MACLAQTFKVKINAPEMPDKVLLNVSASPPNYWRGDNRPRLTIRHWSKIKIPERSEKFFKTSVGFAFN